MEGQIQGIIRSGMETPKRSSWWMEGKENEVVTWTKTRIKMIDASEILR